jgi:5,10-methylenetetrahydromethanopterin reductase
MVSIAQRAEAAGFESAWVAETRLTRDAIAPAAAIALGTDRLRVGTAIVNVYTRNPVLLALTFATQSRRGGSRWDLARVRRWCWRRRASVSIDR